MQLNDLEIAARCQGITPMLSPFRREKIVIKGRSAGLSSASYDVCIGDDLILGPQPQYLIRDFLLETDARKKVALRKQLENMHPAYALANTEEDFHMPDDVVGYVVDKSSYARVFTSAFNTLIDPGFIGNLTLELVNLSDRQVEFKKGQPVCQIAFHRLTGPTSQPYAGKYQFQTKQPHPARYDQDTIKEN